ncbi:hypothetical protein M0R45_025919 [Rubus argutus]|uniref:Uncharacterized protein n=1 Tax=Rubus argutus TaxID=59490 RepID=A0AAW1WYC0_RUBAR
MVIWKMAPGEAKEIDDSAMGRGRKGGTAAGLSWSQQRTVAEERWAMALEVLRGTRRCRLGGNTAEKTHGLSRSWLDSAWATTDGENDGIGGDLAGKRESTGSRARRSRADDRRFGFEDLQDGGGSSTGEEVFRIDDYDGDVQLN